CSTCFALLIFYFIVQCCTHTCALPSFPTRRSSDLDYVVRTRKNQRYSSGGFQTAWKRLMKKLPEEARFKFMEIRPKARSDADDKDRKSTRLNSSHVSISYAVFCLKKKKHTVNNVQI